MKKILLITRPISPPWDEASKNFAYFLAKNVKAVEINLMTKHGVFLDFPQTVSQHPVYTTAEIAEFSLEQKLRSLFFQFFMRGKFDINHYFFTPTRLNSFFIKNFLTSKKTKSIQTIATLREDLWSDSDIKNLLFGDLIITYSEYAKNKLNALGFQNVKRIYPGIDLEKYYREPKNESTLKFFNIKENEFIITYPGEYVRLGATDDIVKILPTLFKKIPNAKFVFANRVKNDKDAQKKAEIIEKFKADGILDKIVFTDTFSDMQKVYNMSDLVIFPVKNMQGKFDVPLVVIEAMACEKPIIISDLPILKEFSNEQNSVMMETGNNEDLLTKIIELSQNVFLRDQISTGARRYVEENFDIKNVAQKYEEVYKNLS